MIIELDDCENIIKNTKTNHRQVRLLPSELKRLQENMQWLLEYWRDEDLCCCDSGDWRVGIQGCTCEVHAIAWIVADLIERQKAQPGTKGLKAVAPNHPPSEGEK